MRLRKEIALARVLQKFRGRYKKLSGQPQKIKVQKFFCPENNLSKTNLRYKTKQLIIVYHAVKLLFTV